MVSDGGLGVRVLDGALGFRVLPPVSLLPGHLSLLCRAARRVQVIIMLAHRCSDTEFPGKSCRDQF